MWAVTYSKEEIAHYINMLPVTFTVGNLCVAYNP